MATEREIMFPMERELGEHWGTYTGREEVSTAGKTGPFWEDAS